MSLNVDYHDRYICDIEKSMSGRSDIYLIILLHSLVTMLEILSGLPAYRSVS